jgi:hypothetical protein
MAKIYLHHVDVLDGKGAIRGRSKYDVVELNVIGENERFIVIDDAYFTTIEKAGKKDEFRVYPLLNIHSTSVFCNDSTWGSGVWYKLYSYERVSPSKIRADIRAAIKKKVGFFMDKIDLSFIKDAK